MIRRPSESDGNGAEWVVGADISITVTESHRPRYHRSPPVTIHHGAAPVRDSDRPMATVQVQTRLPVELREWLDREAGARMVSISFVVTKALERFRDELGQADRLTSS